MVYLAVSAIFAVGENGFVLSGYYFVAASPTKYASRDCDYEAKAIRSSRENAIWELEPALECRLCRTLGTRLRCT